MSETKKSRRGFGSMDPDRVREIASKGGKAAHAAGTAHQFTSEEAKIAGRKGGLAERRGRRKSPLAINGDEIAPAKEERPAS